MLNLYLVTKYLLSIEISFSKMKLIKTHLRSSKTKQNLSYVMKISLEAPAELSVNQLEITVDICHSKRV